MTADPILVDRAVEFYEETGGLSDAAAIAGLTPSGFWLNLKRRGIKAKRKDMRGCTDEERFWACVDKQEACWLWIGAKNGWGYGSFKLNGRTTPAHRAVLILAGVELKPGRSEHVHHTCRNKACVKPDHLELLTASEHMFADKSVTHCKRGHPLSGDNLYVKPGKGHRACRTCRREAAARLKKGD